MKTSIGSCDLYLGDSREIIPSLTGYNAIVTDPPYGIGAMVGGYGREGKVIANDENLDVCSEVIKCLWDTAMPDWLIAFYSARITPQFLAEMPTDYYYGDVVWDKAVPGMGAGIRYAHENAAVFRRNDAVFGDTIFSVIRQPRIADVHPHEKPTGLMARLVQLTTGPVIDPFMGSGSTGAACARLGRPFIGIELDPKHYEQAVLKVESEERVDDMFYGEQEPLL